jgi:hypothetical protein
MLKFYWVLFGRRVAELAGNVIAHCMQKITMDT